MPSVRSRSGVPVRLTEERWQHIVHGHPEMEDRRQQVLETLAEPDMIHQGDAGELLAIRFWPGSPAGRFVVVAYREIGPEDGFILTAYMTRRPSGRRVTLWKR